MQVARVQATALHLSPRKIYQQHSPPRSHVCVACVHLPIEKKKKLCKKMCGVRWCVVHGDNTVKKTWSNW